MSRVQTWVGSFHHKGNLARAVWPMVSAQGRQEAVCGWHASIALVQGSVGCQEAAGDSGAGVLGEEERVPELGEAEPGLSNEVAKRCRCGCLEMGCLDSYTGHREAIMAGT